MLGTYSMGFFLYYESRNTAIFLPAGCKRILRVQGFSGGIEQRLKLMPSVF